MVMVCVKPSNLMSLMVNFANNEHFNAISLTIIWLSTQPMVLFAFGGITGLMMDGSMAGSSWKAAKSHQESRMPTGPPSIFQISMEMAGQTTSTLAQGGLSDTG